MRKPLKKRARFRGALAPQAPRVVETKYVDGYLDSTALTELTANDATWAGAELNPRQFTAVYGCLPVPKEGTGYSERDGRKIFMKNIKIRGTIRFTAQTGVTTAATGQQFVRLVVVKDKRTNGTELSAENVLSPGTGSDGNASLTADTAIMSMTNPNGWGRYEIKFDKLYRVPPLSSWYDGVDGNINAYDIPFKINVKVNDYVNFDASTGAVTSIVDNSFHLLAACGGAGGVPNCSVSYLARTAFLG